MQKNKAVVAIVILSALGLGACSKKSATGFKAKSKIARTAGNETEVGDVYQQGLALINEDIAFVNERGAGFGSNFVTKKLNKILPFSVKPEHRDEVKKRLEHIVSVAKDNKKNAESLNQKQYIADMQSTIDEANYLIDQVNNAG